MNKNEKNKIMPYMIELIQAGIKPGEMSAIFPAVSPNTIKDIIKGIRGNAKLEEYLAYRDTDKIKEIIRRGIEKGAIAQTPRVECLLDKIDELAPTLSGRTGNISRTLRNERLKEAEVIIARENIYNKCQEWRRKMKNDVSRINLERSNTTPARINTQLDMENVK